MLTQRHDTTSDIAESDLILLHQNRENKLSPTFEPEPYRLGEEWKCRPGFEKDVTETELPAPSVTTNTPKEGVIIEQDPIGGIQDNFQTQAVPLPLTPASEGSVRKRETPNWMKEFVCQ